MWCSVHLFASRKEWVSIMVCILFHSCSPLLSMLLDCDCLNINMIWIVKLHVVYYAVFNNVIDVNISLVMHQGEFGDA